MRPIVASLAFACLALAQSHLRQREAIKLDGVAGRIDHFSADARGRRLFVSALVNRSIEVVDIDSGKRIRSIPGVPEPQGVLYHQPSDRLYAACRADGSVRVYEAASLKPVNSVRLAGTDADNVRFDERSRCILIGYGDGALAILDEHGKKTADIPLAAHPESFQLERKGTRAFVNVPDKREIQVVDLRTRQVVARWPVTKALQNYPMALDEGNQRLLVGCRQPATLLVLDTNSGKTVASIDIVGDTDDLFYDSERKLIYVIGGAGYVDVIKQTTPDSYERIGRQETAKGARTGLWVKDWNRLFVAVPKSGTIAARILVFETN